MFDFYEYFGEIPKQNLSYYFLGKIFFKTFFSWSAEIRNTFYHVLLVRINRGGFTVEDQELARRYRKVISLAKASAVIKKKQNRDLAAVELSYVKKMKRKIYERRIRSINSPD